MEISLARELISDEEWAFNERFILAVRAPNERKPTNHRLVLNRIFWIARTGSLLRNLPEEFGKWSSVYRRFRLGTPRRELRGNGDDQARRGKGYPQGAPDRCL